ncbi:MAG: aminomethyl-transferring glycine dehydrogenase [Gemmatimonadetes bacterium]|nr:aminomethyl-transferring glycine dehydrogenase [Gemmatimonadota bacterium]MYB67119.1 aminomethyl-transferring glycine dehydrogenase [Gemmatimonadota bacterium]
MGDEFGPSDDFVRRHIGPTAADVAAMLAAVEADSLDDLMAESLPAAIRMQGSLALGEGISEYELMGRLRELAGQNRICRSFIGMGYSDCITPPVIQRNILENPGWYTQYTPYQSEIAQGRLEALLNFQTMVCDLTGFALANASLLDEATAAAEAIAMLRAVQKKNASQRVFVSSACHPQTIAVVKVRAESRGWEVVVGDHREYDFATGAFAALIQYPASDGALYDYADFCAQAHAHQTLVCAAVDLLALCLLRPPGEFGADAAIGSAQRFGMPMGYGGPHAAFLATRSEFRRQVPGRIIGVSEDVRGRPALRMALQTREQHIKRERATSNICTAEVLPAVVASMYAVYHGPDGLQRIAHRVHCQARALAQGLEEAGYRVVHDQYFDTLRVEVGEQGDELSAQARAKGMNFRDLGDRHWGIALDETTDKADLQAILALLGGELPSAVDAEPAWGPVHVRHSRFMEHPVFASHHSETEMMRYMRRLEAKDLSLVHAMIPLGSCTMKLNATAEMMAITWPEFAGLHPFVPVEQAQGYAAIFTEMEDMLREITGLKGVSLQPNAGSQGEYAGLLIVRKYHQTRGEALRSVCLIPASAHGTNPASAVMAGLDVVVVACDVEGNIDLADLRAKADAHRERLAALMVTYPSTHGVFEEAIGEICAIVHQAGGQVYMDGANMNALVGLCRPGEIGIDVCHLNLHKTFCIPHGGGGPGMGPIAVAEHLVEFLPSHPLVHTGGAASIGPIAAAPWGSASILLISWAYLRLMGSAGLTEATQVAILNANYLSSRLADSFPVLYKGHNGRVAHECILDLRWAREHSIGVEDVAKRLMDYGFHAPTVSFPVVGTLMVEPTESESKAELDRFCEAMIAIGEEIRQVAAGEMDPTDNPLVHAPHPMDVVLADEWDRPYSRTVAALPTPWLLERKFWPAVGRLNDAQGDRNLICSCPPVEAYSQEE